MRDLFNIPKRKKSESSDMEKTQWNKIISTD